MTTATMGRHVAETDIDRELEIASRVYRHPVDALVEIDRIFKAYYFRVGESIHNNCHPEWGSTINPVQTTAGVEVGIVVVHWTHLRRGRVEIQASVEFRQ
jgi:hypothetical protein